MTTKDFFIWYFSILAKRYGLYPQSNIKQKNTLNKKSDECGAHVYIVPQRAA